MAPDMPDDATDMAQTNLTRQEGAMEEPITITMEVIIEGKHIRLITVDFLQIRRFLIV